MLSLRHKNILKHWRLLLVLIVMVAGMGEVKGQRTYATTQRSGITSNVVLGATVATGTVTNAPYSTDTDYSNSTTLSTTSTLGVGTAWIQLIFPASINANSTSFIKINNSAGALLGGEVTVKAYTGSTTSSDGTGVSITSPIGTITSPDGSTFLVVTPNASYNSIRITLSSPVALGSNSASVYYGFNEQPGTGCSNPLATSTSVTGISVGGGITTPNNAIDNDLSTSSILSVGLLGVAASIKQMVYFSSQSKPGDAATVTFSVPSGLLTLGLFDGITLTAYNGATQVGTPIAFSSLLSLNLLYLGSGNHFTASFVPSGIFDRVEISTSSLASVLGSLYLYEIQRTPSKPTFLIPGSVSSATICSGTAVTLKADAAATGNELRWYSAQTGGTLLASTNTYTPSPSLTATTIFYVAMAKTGCTAESERVPVTVTVNPLPTANISGTTSVCQSATSPSITFTGANATAPYTFTYNINGGTNTTITTTSGNSVSLSVPTATPGTLSYNLISVKESSATQCSNNQTGTATVTINPKPPHPTTSISSN